MMLCILFSIYHITTVLSQCPSNLTNYTLKLQVLLGGQYFNTSGIDGRDIDEAVQRLDETEQCQSFAIHRTTYPKVTDWYAGRQYYRLINPSQIESLLAFYGDLDQVNNNLQGKHLSTVPTNNDIVSYGNIIICNISICPNMTRIGPPNQLFMEYRPIAMHTDIHLDHIINIPSNQDTSIDKIDILILFYAIHSNESDILNVIETHLFPETMGSVAMRAGLSTSEGIYVATYTDLDKLNDNLGRPNTWNLTYNGYYMTPDDDPNVILYVYGISVLCSNEAICNEYLNPSDKDAFTKKWITIAVIFMILFAASVCIIICLLIKLGICTEKAKKGGYQQPVETEQDGGGYTQ